MDSTRNVITSGQLTTFIFSTEIGLPLIFLPQLYRFEGHDGWISLLIAGAVSSVLSILIVKLLNRYRDKSIFEINKLLFGRYAGFILNAAFIAYLVLSAALYSRLLGDCVKDIILKKTPAPVLTISLILPTIYLTYYGLKPISRFSNTIYVILATLLMYYMLVCKFYRLTFIMPVGEAGLHNILKGAYISSYCYLGPELTVIFYPYVKDKMNVTKAVLKANIGAMALFVLTIAIVTMFFGENMLKFYYMPVISLSRAYKAPVLERVDIYFIAAWFPALAISVRGYFFSAYYSLDKILSLKNKFYYLIVYVAIIYFLGRIPKSIEDGLHYLNYINVLGLYVFAYLILCLAFSFVNKRGVGEL